MQPSEGLSLPKKNGTWLRCKLNLGKKNNNNNNKPNKNETLREKYAMTQVRKTCTLMSGLVFVGHWSGRRPGRRGRRLGRGRHQHLQQPVVLTPAGGAVAVLGRSLDELDADFVLLELDQEPAAQEDTVLDPAGSAALLLASPHPASYSSEMSMLSCSRLAPVRCSLVMISIRCSLLSKKSPLMAEAEP